QCTCTDVNSPECCSEATPYRRAVAGGSSPPPPPPSALVKTREEVWTAFSTSCGKGTGCHVGPLGPDFAIFQFTEDTFDARPDLGTESMERILESNEVLAMPQQEGPGDHRRCG